MEAVADVATGALLGAYVLFLGWLGWQIGVGVRAFARWFKECSERERAAAAASRDFARRKAADLEDIPF